MSSEDEQVAWLREQIEGDKTAALATSPSGRRLAWRTDFSPGSEDEAPSYWVISDPDPAAAALAMGLEGDTGPQVGEHVARHDPQDVIADREAKLALLDVHTPVESDDQIDCAVCVTWEDDESLGECVAVPVLWPCMTLEIVAAGYRHRPGYADHWDAQPCPACGKPDVVLPLGHSAAVPMGGGPATCMVSQPLDPAAFMLPHAQD